MYHYYNRNPYNNKILDCAIRAISTVSRKSWDETYQELSDHARRMGLMMDSVESVEDYLDERYPRQCHYSKTLEEFAEEFPFGRYIVSQNGHLTCVINGEILDIFDPSRNPIRCSWLVVDK